MVPETHEQVITTAYRRHLQEAERQPASPSNGSISQYFEVFYSDLFIMRNKD